MPFRVFRPRSCSFGRSDWKISSPPVLVDESLAFLELSKLCQLSLHCLKWNTAKKLVQTSIKVATHSEVDTNNRSSSWNLPKSLHNSRSKEFDDEEPSWFAASFANAAIP